MHRKYNNIVLNVLARKYNNIVLNVLKGTTVSDELEAIDTMINEDRDWAKGVL